MICYLPVYFVHKDEAEQIVGIATLLTKLSVGIPHPALACSIDAASNGATAHEHAAQLEAQYTDVLALGALTKSEEFFLSVQQLRRRSEVRPWLAHRAIRTGRVAHDRVASPHWQHLTAIFNVQLNRAVASMRRSKAEQLRDKTDVQPDPFRRAQHRE